MTATTHQVDARSTTDQAPRLEVISLDQLRESPLNTRKHFDPIKLAELKASIEKSGILTPLLVRPNVRLRERANGAAYEIAAGHRRFRAGKLAGVAAAPCIVRELDDATFLEILTIENLQREDVHPLEEAQGYRNLLTLDGYDIKKIAARVGKSESYVYDRMKLLQLAAPAQKLFFTNRFTLAHAILLARLSKDDQKRCLDVDNENGYGQAMAGGMWQHEGPAHPPLGLDDPAGITVEDDEPTARLKPVSVRELQAWIDDHVRFNGPDASIPHLFADTAANLDQAKAAEQKVIEISRDHQLREDAKHPDGQRTYCVTSWARADGQPGDLSWGELQPSVTCEYSVLGVVVAGRGRGESFQVCIDKKRCTTHWGDVIKERNRREREREKDATQEGSGKSKKEPGKPSWQIEEERRKAATARAKARWEKGSEIVLAAIADKLEDLKMDSTGPTGTYVWELMENGIYGLDARAKLAARYGLKRGKTPVEFMRHVIMCALIDTGEPGFRGDSEKELQKDLDALRINVNVKALLDAANPAPKPEAPVRPAKPAKQRPAKAVRR